ncbi:AIR carboxylase family protein [Candidatus Woesearchaeota archaeon]|nr:AIR carboxylase family protein [Candidatus Woesearchaeota archaeon]
MSDRFRELVEQNIGCAVILAGSGSDEQHVSEICAAMAKYKIPQEVRIQSAHNDSEAVMRLVRHYDNMSGALAYITVAGGVDFLSGFVARHSLRPVISCPPDVPNDGCLGNPPLSSNMYVRNPKNVARAVAQIFSHLNSNYVDQLLKDIHDKGEELQEKDKSLKAKLSWVPEA